MGRMPAQARKMREHIMEQGYKAKCGQEVEALGFFELANTDGVDDCVNEGVKNVGKKLLAGGQCSSSDLHSEVPSRRCMSAAMKPFEAVFAACRMPAQARKMREHIMEQGYKAKCGQEVEALGFSSEPTKLNLAIAALAGSLVGALAVAALSKVFAAASNRRGPPLLG